MQDHEEKRAAANVEAEAQAAAEAAEDGAGGSDYGFADYCLDGGSQEDELQGQFLGEGAHSRISKKKRKKIIKSNSAGPKVDGGMLQGSFLCWL